MKIYGNKIFDNKVLENILYTFSIKYICGDYKNRVQNESLCYNQNYKVTLKVI